MPGPDETGVPVFDARKFAPIRIIHLGWSDVASSAFAMLALGKISSAEYTYIASSIQDSTTDFDQGATATEMLFATELYVCNYDDVDLHRTAADPDYIRARHGLRDSESTNKAIQLVQSRARHKIAAADRYQHLWQAMGCKMTPQVIQYALDHGRVVRFMANKQYYVLLPHANGSYPLWAAQTGEISFYRTVSEVTTEHGRSLAGDVISVAPFRA